MNLHPVLLTQLNEALRPRPAASKRTRRDARLPPLPNKVHAVIGMRRAGKTTFLKQLVDEKRATVEPERAIFLGFDDDRLADLEADQLSLLLEEYFRRFPDWRGEEGVAWYLDEIQMVQGWERFVRRVIDTELVEIVVAGSSAKMLSREIHTSLRGRGIATVIRPFSFREALRHLGEEPAASPDRWTPAERSAIEKRFRQYLVQGGFPEVQGLGDGLRTELLQGYVDAVLFRDIVERFAVSQVASLRWLVRHCLRNPAGAFSIHRLHLDLKAQGLGIAKDALHELLGHLIDAFLVSSVPLATDSERRRNSNPRKLYPIDPGLIRAFDSSGRANAGHALETRVMNELADRRAELGYVKTVSGYEVDFLARFPDGREELIQVCAELADPSTLERELRALDEARIENPRAERRLLTLDREPAIQAGVADVKVEPVYEWLLAHQK